MLLVPWIDPTKIVLTAYAIDLREKQSEQDVFQLDNSSHLFGTFAASRVHKQEVRWDVTEMIIDLQRRKNSSWFPLILIMNCLDQNCRFSHDSWRLHTYPAFSNLILLPETQAVLELYTQSTIGLVKLYGDRRVQKRSTPSPDNDCPSFLDPNVRHTRCCLFRFTLNKQQMDQNDMLRFIIFPHHLPVGSSLPLLFQFFGLGKENRSARKYGTSSEHRISKQTLTSFRCSRGIKPEPFRIRRSRPFI
ncbi:uncharacterized protein DEA37_0003369 [Paragonimus westermani]|uniref:Uncharacterized protein n=1 Tax=Paragonimus westermani TaxID=34504 RepID=A0A5J4P3K3_9TREM|nr:uncharacterized protein DEA37_0003369 [Paragonimus westermani]